MKESRTENICYDDKRGYIMNIKKIDKIIKINNM